MKCENNRCENGNTKSAQWRCWNCKAAVCRDCVIGCGNGVYLCRTCATPESIARDANNPAERERDRHTEDAKSYFEWLARDLPRRD